MFFFVNRLPRFAIRCANANDSVRIMSQKTRRPNRNLALSYFCRARTAAKTMDATDGWPKMIRLGNRKSHFGDKTNRRRIAHLKTQCCHHRKKYFLFQKHRNQTRLIFATFRRRTMLLQSQSDETTAPGSADQNNGLLIEDTYDKTFFDANLFLATVP